MRFSLSQVLEADARTWSSNVSSKSPGCEITRLYVSYALDHDPKNMPRSSAIPKLSQELHQLSDFHQFGRWSPASFFLHLCILSKAPATSASIALLAFEKTQILLTEIQISLSTAFITVPHLVLPHYLLLPLPWPRTACHAVVVQKGSTIPFITSCAPQFAMWWAS